MTFAYGAGGLTLVADRGLYGLTPAPSDEPDIRLHVDTVPAWAPLNAPYYSSPNVDADGVPALQVVRADDGYAWAFADGARFWVDHAGRTIWMTFATTLEDACTYLAGPVLSFTLRLRGEFSLHASAVAVGDRALAFAGPHAAGKSTIAAALGRSGYSVLTDDILRLTPNGRGWQAHSFGSVLRLWPDGETMVFGSSGRLERLTPLWEKRALAIGASGVPAAPPTLPLAGIAFLLADTSRASVAMAPLTPAEALIRLASNSSAGYLLDGPGRRHEFCQIASIAADVPCVDITRPIGSPSLDELLATLQGWVQSLTSTTGLRA